jgi:hypothetical protein
LTLKSDVGGLSGRGTYREVEFASFRDFLWKDFEELEQARYAALVGADLIHNDREDVLPFRHLNS